VSKAEIHGTKQTTDALYRNLMTKLEVAKGPPGKRNALVSNASACMLSSE